MQDQMIDKFIQAAMDGNLGFIVDQLRAGHDPNSPDQHGWIALHRAALKNRVKVIKVLIEHGSSLTALGTDGWMPLHLATVSASLDAVRTLLEAGADTNAQSEFGDTPLHLSIISQNPKIVRLLLEGGADPSVKNEKGLTPVEKARNESKTALVALMEKPVKRPKSP